MSPETLRMVYFEYIHSIMNYGIILGGNQPYSDKILKIQNGWLELSQIQEWEIHVGNRSKN